MSFLDAARTVLSDSGEPLHYKDITQRALDGALVVTKGKTPWDTMAAQLATHIKRNGPAAEFMRTKPGCFALASWGLAKEPEPDLKARVSHLPTWQALRGFLSTIDGQDSSTLSALRSAIRSLKGQGRDFSHPETWMAQELSGDAQALGFGLFQASKGALNPRYVSNCVSLANRYDLMEEDDDGVLHLTSDGADFLANEGGAAELGLDANEGVARVLAIVAEHGPEKSAALLGPYMDWAVRNTGLQSESTGRVSLHARLANLAHRGLAERTGHTWAVTAAGLTRLGRDPDALHEDASDEDQDELFDLVREINEQQQRVRHRIREALYAMDPYAFEHLIKRLLDEMGYDGVEVTKASSDKGVDVVGTIQVGITEVTEVIQAKRTKGNVGRPVLDALRGSLYRWSAQRGTIITTAGFSKGARSAAFDIGAAPIQLIDGDTLVRLLVENGIGLKQQQMKLWRFDPEPFKTPDVEEELEE